MKKKLFNFKNNKNYFNIWINDEMYDEVVNHIKNTVSKSKLEFKLDSGVLEYDNDDEKYACLITDKRVKLLEHISDTYV